ncbi:hypothetical protein DYH09_35195 [bacterium CPR1]|nr:hypothetical protein [bacterium CPR1]
MAEFQDPSLSIFSAAVHPSLGKLRDKASLIRNGGRSQLQEVAYILASVLGAGDKQGDLPPRHAVVER